MLGVSVAVLALMCARPALATGDVGILPPDLDYKKVCIPPESLQKDDFNWTGKTAATSGLPPERLIKIAQLYYNGSGETPPDYQRASDIVEYLLVHGGDVRNEALFLKYDMLLKGRWFPQNTNMAKAILDELIRNNDAKAHSRYGDLYVDEGDYIKAAEHYKKAFMAGEPTASLSLAYLYHDKKIPATDAEIDAAIMQAQDAAMQYLVRGNCHALTLFGLMYGRLNNLPRFEYYSAKWFEKAALIDEIAPKLALATIIQRGYVLPYDEKRILELWREAAALGSDRAMFLLGEHAFLNHKSDDDLKNAVVWFEKAAARRNIKAMEMLASLYDGRYASLKDRAKERKWLETAIEHEDVKDFTIMKLADIYEEDANILPEKIVALYMKAAGKGNNDAFLKLGEAYRYGAGVDAAPAKALRYYRLAASNGQTLAMEALKQAYECGVGADKDPQKTAFWKNQIEYFEGASVLDEGYRFLLAPTEDKDKRAKVEESLTLMAVGRDNIEAMVLLGLFFEKVGETEKSEKWLKKALTKDEEDKKDFTAHALLGQITLEGKYKKADSDKALPMLEKARAAGNAGAANTLGKWYKGHGDMARAEGYFVAAGEHGKPSAFIKLAEISIDRKDTAAAIAYLERASRYHEIGAMLKLAEGYSEGGWVDTPDPAKANEWFDKALSSHPCKAADTLAIAKAYLEGRYGLAKNEQEAGKWLGGLAELDPEDKDSLKVSRMILSSSLTMSPQKQEIALTLLKKAAAEGDVESATFLAGLYMEKSFAGHNSEEAFQWMTKSAENGDIVSMMELSNMYMSGYGVPPSVETATLWLKKASAAGSDEATQRLKKMGIKP